MDLVRESLQYVADNPDRFRDEVLVHLRLSVTSLILAILIFIPLGVIVSRGGRSAGAIVNAVAAARVVPSLAVLFLLVPVMGLGERPALVALTVLAGPVLVINTDAGLRNIDPAVLESARGLGMTPVQVFGRVELPLALPVMIAGIRSASVEIMASATLAAFIGAGGLGSFITSGLTLIDYRLLLVGAIPVTLLMLLAEVLLGGLERWLTPPTGSRTAT